MPGPAPKPPGTRQRRNATVPMVALPSTGRKGTAPKWPLSEDIGMKVKRSQLQARAEQLQAEIEDSDSIKTQRKLEREMAQALTQVSVIEEHIAAQAGLELELWKDLWSTPQAQMWEQLAWDREVAQYVRWKVRGELGDLEAAKEARMWSDRLGLNPLAMLRLRWEIERVEAVEEAGAQRRTRSTPAKPATKPEDPRKGLYAV